MRALVAPHLARVLRDVFADETEGLADRHLHAEEVAAVAPLVVADRLDHPLCQREALVEEGQLPEIPILSAIAATSVVIVDGETRLDPCYEEDSSADADFNIVMTSEGEFVEVQGTAEGMPYSRHALNEVLAVADGGIRELLALQRDAISGASGS